MKKTKENELNYKLGLNEYQMLVELDHPNLVKVFELFENDNSFFIVAEVCKGGDLRQELINSGLYSENRAALLMKQVLECVDYFHSKHIVHRDLKPGSKLNALFVVGRIF